MKLLVYEVLERVAAAKTKAEKIKILQENQSGALNDVLRGTFDERIVWLLPDTAPPYIASPAKSPPSNLLRECVKLAYFAKGGKAPDMSNVRRESLFIQLLESIHPKDADVLIDMIQRKAPKGITRPLIKEAFPSLLP